MNRLSLLAALAMIAAPVAAFAQTAPAPTAPAATVPAPAAVAPSAKAAPTEAEKAARAKFRTACSADFAKYCADAMPVADQTAEQAKVQRGKMRACIAAHQADISAGCKSAIAERDAAVAAKKS